MAGVYTTAVVSGKRVAAPALIASVDSGMSQATAQGVLDAAAVGSTIVIDGDCPFALTASKKLLLLGKNSKNTWIDGARTGTETWTDQSVAQSTSDLFSCSMAYTPNVVLLAALDNSFRYHLVRYDSLAELKLRKMPVTSSYTDSYNSGAGRAAGIGPQAGYTVAGGLLYVRLPSGLTPSTVNIKIARSGAGAGITIAANDVTIAGLRFTCWDTACIVVNAEMQRPSVYDCYGEGSQRFYQALSTGATLATNGAIIEYNEFNGGKLYTWRTDSLTKEMWQALYDSNVSCRFVRANTQDIQVRHNYFYETFDGIEVKGFNTTSQPITCIIEYNVGDGVVDNHLEIEPWDQNIFLVVRCNFLKDGFTPFATAPFGGTGTPTGIRVEMVYNIYWHSLHGIAINDTDGSVQNVALLKSLTHSGIDARVITQRGIQWSHNTARIDGGAGCRLYTVGTEAQNEQAEQSAYDLCEANLNIVDGGSGFTSRLWALTASPVPSGGTGTPSPAVGTARPGTGYPLRKNVFRGGSVTASDYVTASPSSTDTRAPTGDVIQTDPAWAGGTGLGYFTPTNATILSRGDGAVQSGAWGFQGTPGPRWATAANMPQRRAWHANVSKSIVNLA